jgi:hypothetical protein
MLYRTTTKGPSRAVQKLYAVMIVLGVFLAVAIMAAPTIQELYGPLPSIMVSDRSPE